MLNRTPSINPPGAPAHLTASPQRPKLQRIVTGSAMTVTADIVDHYQTGTFEDPKPERAYFKGPQVFTDGHKRLIKALREECHNLYANGRNLRGKVSALEYRLARRHDEVIDLRQTLNSQNATISVLQTELEAANQSISALDQVMIQSRSNRVKRMSQLLHDETLEFVGIKDAIKREGVGRAE